MVKLPFKCCTDINILLILLDPYGPFPEPNSICSTILQRSFYLRLQGFFYVTKNPGLNDPPQPFVNNRLALLLRPDSGCHFEVFFSVKWNVFTWSSTCLRDKIKCCVSLQQVLISWSWLTTRGSEWPSYTLPGNHLGICSKCTFSSPSSEVLNQKLWGGTQKSV